MARQSSIKTKKEKALKIIEILKELYPDSGCSLVYDEPFKLLVEVRLAAQCTDKRVNEVCKELFRKYPTPQAIAASNPEEFENLIKPCGLHKQKSKDIRACMDTLVKEFNGVVPDDMKSLLSLPGVGRKSANLILGDIYNKPAIVTDTHCIRITGRLGLTSNKEPFKVEKDLWAIIPPDEGNYFCHRLVDFSREICTARNPYCSQCKLTDYCSYYKEQAL